MNRIRCSKACFSTGERAWVGCPRAGVNLAKRTRIRQVGDGLHPVKCCESAKRCRLRDAVVIVGGEGSRDLRISIQQSGSSQYITDGIVNNIRTNGRLPESV